MITSDQLRALLVQAGYPPLQIVLPDTVYSLPDEKCIPDLGDRFLALLKACGLYYTPESFDCDDFALQAMAHAKREHAMFSGLKTGVAIGLGHGLTDAGGHARVVAAHRINGNLVLAHYEPQPVGQPTIDHVTFKLCLTPSESFSPPLFCYA